MIINYLRLFFLLLLGGPSYLGQGFARDSRNVFEIAWAQRRQFVPWRDNTNLFAIRKNVFITRRGGLGAQILSRYLRRRTCWAPMRISRERDMVSQFPVDRTINTLLYCVEALLAILCPYVTPLFIAGIGIVK